MLEKEKDQENLKFRFGSVSLIRLFQFKFKFKLRAHKNNNNPNGRFVVKKLRFCKTFGASSEPDDARVWRVQLEQVIGLIILERQENAATDWSENLSLIFAR